MDWRQINQTASRFNDRSAMAAANSLDQQVQQQFANGMTLLEMMRRPVESSQNGVLSQVVAQLAAIDRRLDALERAS